VPFIRSGVPWNHRLEGHPLRKYIFSSTLISAVLGGWGTLQTTRKGPRDWRLVLMWISWAITVVIAVDSVIGQSRNADELRE
jgi:hypothetical protein